MIVVRLAKLFESIKQTLFIIGSGIICFLALRNSIVWLMQTLWGASADFWQKRWEEMYYIFDGNDTMVAIVGSFVYTTLVFWLLNIFFMTLDITGWPSFLLKYKIQPEKNCPLQKADFLRAAKMALFNQIVVGLPFSVVTWELMKRRGCSCSPQDLPTFHWAVFEMTVFTLVEEVGFYYTHRLFHHPRIYKYIHKKHHEWTASISIVSIYAHPVEHLLSNLMPAMLGPLIMGSHLATAWMFWALALFSTTIAHCGYHFPFLPSPEAHDFHHLKFNNNFGVLGVLDRLHGTDVNFRNSMAYKRHFMLLSLVPVTQTVPNEPKKKPE